MELPPETSKPPVALPPVTTEAHAEVQKCIQCISARQDETIAITLKNIQTCRNLTKIKVWGPITKLVQAGVLEKSTDVDPAALVGQANATRTMVYKLTEQGTQLLPPQAQETCELSPPKNLLEGLAPKQARVAACLRCILAKTDDEGQPPAGVTSDQIARCTELLKITVGHTLSRFVKGGLLRKIPNTMPVLQRGPPPHLYTPTERAAQFFEPQPLPACGLDAKIRAAEFAHLTPIQKNVLRCLACLQRASLNNPETQISVPAIRQCDPRPAVDINHFFK